MDDIRESIAEDVYEKLKKEKSYLDMMGESTFKELDAAIKKFKESVTSMTGEFTEFNQATENIKEALKSSPKVFEEFEKKAKKLIASIKTGDPKASEYFEKEIAPFENAEGITADAKEFFEKLKKATSPEALNAIIENMKLGEQKSKEYEDMMQRIVTTKSTNIDNMFGSMGINLASSRTNANPYAVLFEKFKTNPEMAIEGLKAYHKILLSIYADMLSFSNLTFNAFKLFKQQMISNIKTLDEVSSNFLKVTGLTEDYTAKIYEGWKQNLSFNITMQDISHTYEQLIDNMRSFTYQSEANQRSIVDYVAKVGRLGVGFDNAQKVFAYFSETLQQGTEEAKASFSSLLGLTKTTGETLKKITSDFIAVLPQLAKHGNMTKQIFKELFATAKSLKLETTELLQISENFDTFESAAKSVGRLNAILGGPYLNSIKMMNQSEGERIQSLNEAFRATGKNWASLQKYERQAIAASVGINDLTVAEKMFGGSLADTERAMRERSLSQEELEERNRRAASLQEKWNNLLSSMATLLEPILTLLHDMTGLFLKATNVLGPLTVPALFLAAGAFMKLTKGLFGLGEKTTSFLASGIWTKLTKLFKSTSSPAEAAKDAIEKVAETTAGAAAKAAPAAGSLWKSFTTVGTGLARSSVQIAQAILFIGGAIAIVVGLFMAIKSIGEGIGGLFKGIGKAFEGLGNYLSGAGDALRNNSLTQFIKELTNKNIDPAEKIKSITESVKELSNIMGAVSLSSIFAFADLFDEISDLSEATANNTSANFMKSLSGFMVASSKISPENVENIAKITKNITEITSNNPNKNIEVVLDKLANVLGKETNTSSNSSSATINVYINDKKVASAITDSIYAKGNTNVKIGA